MPRAGQVLVEGGYYRVSDRLRRGKKVFELEAEAALFVSRLKEIVGRDGLTVFAWPLRPNHHHLAVRTGVVLLNRPVRSLQLSTSRGVNRRRQVLGPLWQNRYKAKLAEDPR